MRRVVLFVFSLGVLSGSACPFDSLWTRTYGGTGDDICRSLQVTADGGFILAGYTTSFGVAMNDYYLVRINGSGDTVWTRLYGGRYRDEAYGVCQTPDLGFLVTGWSSSAGSGRLTYTIKTNQIGDTIWTSLYQRTTSSWGWSVRPCPGSSSFIIGGQDNGAPGLILLNATGDTIWTRRYGMYGALYSVQVIADSGFVATGSSGNPAGLLVISTDKNGTARWSKTYRRGTRYDYGQCIRPTTDHGYIIVGCCVDSTDADFWLLKTNSLGDTLWTRRYGGADFDYGYSVVETPDYGYLVVGSTYSFGAGNADIWLLKTNAFGDTLWTATLGDTAADNGYCIEKTLDGNYAVAGTTRSRGAGFHDYYLLKIALQTGIKTAAISPLRTGHRVATIVRSARQVLSEPNGRLFDVTGRPAGRGNRGHIGPGVYFLQPANGSPRKIILIR